MALFGRSDAKFQNALDAYKPPPTWFERVLKKKIVVHTKADQSIEGVLMEVVRDGDGLILRAAVLLGDAGKRTPMAGETFIPRENVAFAQLDE